jgi:hypothetical protein
VGQHLVQVVEHILKELALGAGLDRRQQEFAERAAILQKEDRQQRNYKKEPRLFGDIGRTQADTLGNIGDITFVGNQEAL